MDKHSEVEVKFDAQKVTLHNYNDFLSNLCGLSVQDRLRWGSYKVAIGTDTYYNLNGSILRYREGDMPGGELTYKRRKSEKSIADRVEINLPLSSKVAPDDVHAMMRCLGGTKVFSIDKTSYITHIIGRDHVAVVALYDVTSEDNKTQRFLEVEIESSSSCNEERGREVLDMWIEIVKNNLEVNEPLNFSLFELYSKGK